MRCALAILVLSLASMARADPPEPSLLVVIEGDEELARDAAAALSDDESLGVRVELRPAPHADHATASADDAPIAGARAAYEMGDFARCLDLVTDDVQLRGWIAQGRSVAAARTLLYRVACEQASGRTADAERTARRLASYDLDVPADVGQLPLAIEQLVARAHTEVQGAPTVPLRVQANGSSAAISIDARGTVCTAPCTIDVRPGEHVISAHALGYADDVRTVQVDASGAEVTLEPVAASSALAGDQWARELAARGELDSDRAVRLLAHALGARRLGVVVVQSERDTVQLNGVLGDEHGVLARAGRSAPHANYDVLHDLLRDLLVDARVLEPVELWQSPWFWLVLGGSAVAVAAAILITYFALTGPIETQVTF